MAQYVTKSDIKNYEETGAPIVVFGDRPLYEVIRFDIDRLPVAAATELREEA